MSQTGTAGQVVLYDSTGAEVVVAQAAAGPGQRGLMMMGYVSDTPAGFLSDTLQPLLMTPEGRLRVASVPGNAAPSWGSPFDQTDACVNYSTFSVW